jgi:CBS domain-containing protein
LRGDALLKPELKAEEAMEVGPTTIRPSESLEPLVARMRKRGVKTIVVTDAKGHLVGILYRNDAAKILADLNIDPG